MKVSIQRRNMWLFRAEPAILGHDEYPKFDVDMETEMLGSVKPYARQVRYQHSVVSQNPH